MQVENDFNRVLEWLAANNLIINHSKTHLMLFTNHVRSQSVRITAKGQTINEVTETRFLGVIFYSKLIWNVHINHISKKISRSVAILKILKFTFPSNVLGLEFIT